MRFLTCGALLSMQVLFSEAKLRNTPFEWVYDGLAPALLPQVLKRRKGMPLSLTLVAAAVARRLGMPMQLLCAAEGPPASTASGKLMPCDDSKEAVRSRQDLLWIMPLQHVDRQLGMASPWFECIATER